MGLARLTLAIGLLLVAGAGAVAVAAWHGPGPAPQTGSFDVGITGPANASLFRGVVQVENATALSALRVACEKAGLALEVESYPGMGEYVRAIGGHRASGASGWIYEVSRGGATVSGDRSAAAFALHKGDALQWRWVDA